MNCYPLLATMEADPAKAYNQNDATGFIRLNASRLKVAAQAAQKEKMMSNGAVKGWDEEYQLSSTPTTRFFYG